MFRLIFFALVALSLIAFTAAQAEEPYNVAWSRQIGTASDDRSLSVAADSVGNSYISGCTRGSLGGSNEGDYDAFLSKYDSAGNKLWSRQVGTARWDQSNSVAVDASGNAYISGRTWGSLGGPNEGGL